MPNANSCLYLGQALSAVGLTQQKIAIHIRISPDASLGGNFVYNRKQFEISNFTTPNTNHQFKKWLKKLSLVKNAHGQFEFGRLKGVVSAVSRFRYRGHRHNLHTKFHA